MKSAGPVVKALDDTMSILTKNPVVALVGIQINLSKREKLIKRKLDFLISWCMDNVEMHGTLAFVVGAWSKKYASTIV